MLFRISTLAAACLATAAVMPAAPAAARDIYVDAAFGTMYTSCEYGTYDIPFKTIQLAANCSERPGDVIRIRSGTYRETVAPPYSGTAANPITFQPEPAGAQVVVSGADVITGWAPYTDPGTGLTFWRAPMPWSMGRNRPNPGNQTDGFDQVFLSKAGQDSIQHMIPEARWPNDPDNHPLLNVLGGGHQQWAVAAAGTTATRIVDPGLASLPAPTWNFPNGPQLWVNGGTLNYIGQTTPVTGYSSEAITFAAIPPGGEQFDPRPGSPYYLFGTLPLLDAANEWVWRDDYLYMNHNPDAAGEIVEAKHRDLAFNIEGRSYITVKNLQVFGAGIWVWGTDTFPATHNTFDGVNARYTRHQIVPQVMRHGYPYGAYTGIQLHGAYNVFKNGEIGYSSSYGIELYGADHSVVNNVIHDVGYVSEQIGGVFVTGDRALVAYNTIYNSAYALIYVIQAHDVRIHHNDVSVGNLIDDDGGAIYSAWCDSENTEINHNLIHDFTGVGLGRNVNHGIYLDNGAHSYVVHHNVVWNIGTGTPPPYADWRAANLYFGTPKNWALVYNNTFHASAHGYSVNYFDASAVAWIGDFRQTRFVNNILRDGNRLPTEPSSLAYLPVQRHNLPSTQDPLFVNAAAHDYHLQCGAASPAKDAGEIVPGVTDGWAGAAPDMGAYECNGTAGTQSDPNWTAGCRGSAFCPAGTIPTPSWTAWNPTPYKNLIRWSGFEGVPFLMTTALPLPWFNGGPPGSAQVYLGPQDHGGNSGIQDRRGGGINSMQLGPSSTFVTQTISGLSDSVVKLYEFSAWVRIKNSGDSVTLNVTSGTVNVSETVNFDSGSGMDACYYPASGPCWKLVRIHFRPSAGVGTATLKITKDGSAGFVFVDDIGLAEKPNLAIGGATQASTTYPDYYSPSYINDGIATTDFFGWANDGAAPLPQWVSVDLGVGASPARAELYTTHCYPYPICYWIKAFDLQVKDTGPCDDTEPPFWRNVYSVPPVPGNTQPHVVMPFAQTTAQCIRVLGRAGPDVQPNFVRVNELIVN